MDVLPIHEVEAVKTAWRARVERIFEDEPIPFRKQNGREYPDRHTLADDVAPGQTGLLAHIAM